MNAVDGSALRILLPPSETKRSGGEGASLEAVGFGSGALARHRARVATAVVRSALGRRSTAAKAFGLPVGVTDAALAANAALLSAPTMPALERYGGSVYRALDLASLGPAQRTVAEGSILIFSGLFGVLGGTEPVPDYRVSAAATLPRLGRVGASWRPVLTRHLPDLLGDALVLDLRSTDYAAMWRPDRSGAERVVAVRIRSPGPAGRLSVISFDSKQAKGRLAGALVARLAGTRPPTTVADIADIWVRAGLGDADVVMSAGRPNLELVTAARPGNGRAAAS